MKDTTLKITPEYRDKLRIIADAHKRSMKSQFETMIDAMIDNYVNVPQPPEKALSNPAPEAAQQ